MSLGLQVMDAASNVLLDTSTLTMRLIDTFDVAAGASGTVSDASYSGCKVAAVAISGTVSNVTLPHTVSIASTTVTYTAHGAATPSRIVVFK